LPAKWQESGPPPVGEEAEVANADEAFGKHTRSGRKDRKPNP
jgi:hypothetical protein